MHGHCLVQQVGCARCSRSAEERLEWIHRPTVGVVDCATTCHAVVTDTCGFALAPCTLLARAPVVATGVACVDRSTLLSPNISCVAATFQYKPHWVHHLYPRAQLSAETAQNVSAWSLLPPLPRVLDRGRTPGAGFLVFDLRPTSRGSYAAPTREDQWQFPTVW